MTENILTQDDSLIEMQSKYLDLVWYARSAPAEDPFWLTTKDSIRNGALASQLKVEEKYPEETKELHYEDHGSFNHGFNSGMLACLRYVMEDDRVFAEDNFPDLDT